MSKPSEPLSFSIPPDEDTEAVAAKMRLPRSLASVPYKTERRLAKSIISGSEVGKPKRTRSEMSRASWRADKRRDSEILKFITASMRSKQPLRLTSNAADTVHRAKKSLEAAALSKTRIIPDVGLPHWDHTDPHLKMLAWGIATSEMGAVPFTLHMTTSVFAQAARDKRGPARHIQDKISRHLRNRLGEVPPFWFSIEAAKWIEPHLHGAIVIPSEREDDVRAALVAVGGLWGPRQLSISARRNAATWVTYATKWFYGTKACIFDENTAGATNSVRAAAREWHQKARSEKRPLYPT